jgi:hypothetical protein
MHRELLVLSQLEVRSGVPNTAEVHHGEQSWLLTLLFVEPFRI